jgi:SH3-like domain-containing protein
MPRPFFALLTALVLHLTAPPLMAQASDRRPETPQATRTDTPSGLPVPRFVSLKSERTNCRLGPSLDHPVVVTYLRAGTPVEIIAETTDHWRKIRDRDGLECWAHQSTLRALTHVLVAEEIEIRTQPKDSAPVRARLSAGVLARVIRANRDWRLVSAGGVSGWAPAQSLWGAAR